MKNFTILCIMVYLLTLPSFSSEIPNFKYRELSDNSKICYNDSLLEWEKLSKNTNVQYYTKIKLNDIETSFIDKDGNVAFNTGCEYEFIINKKLIGYSNKDLMFYEFNFDNQTLSKRALFKKEVESILPDYHIISTNDFSKNTNSLKIKKGIKDLNILLLNENNYDFSNYSFSSGNAKFKTCKLNGLLTIQKRGMIQFANGDAEPWFVILVR